MRRTLIASGLISLMFLAWAPPSGPPHITVTGGSPSQRGQLAVAVQAFLEVGLVLHDLEVDFSDDVADCQGHMGLFDTTIVPWRITICSEAEFVYLHELAHAWELASVSEKTREAFMELRGHTAWADPRADRQDRGVEDAAFVIQQGLMERPLPPTLSDEQANRLQAFELLTGVPSPRLRTAG